MTDDYYELLGVDPDAATDEIRTAYRERKAELDATGDSGRADAAKLNRAWNVLSDPYQRGRYDEQRAHDDGDEYEDDDDVEVSTNGKGTPARGARPARQPRQLGPPTITPPPGTKFPVPKQRIIAMAIDLLVLFVMFVGLTQFAARALADSQQPEVVDRIEALDNEIDAQTKIRDDAEDAEKAAREQGNIAAADAEKAKADAADQRVEDLREEASDEAGKLSGIYFTCVAVAFLIGFLYLAIPSLRSGRTLGKWQQKLRVVREDGSPLSFGDVLRRYGTIVLATFAIYVVLRELAGAVVLIGVMGWMRNPNMQGMHDRFAHTIVVADDNG
jgi:uncharacterized RDD family membrane protein YckC